MYMDSCLDAFVCIIKWLKITIKMYNINNMEFTLLHCIMNYF